MKPARLDTLQDAQDPTQSSLAEVFWKTASMRIWDEGISGEEPIGELLREITDAQQISRLGEVLRIVDGPAGHCLCYGDLALELLSADKQRLALLGLHHGMLLRWNAWIEDAELEDGMAVLEWLNNLGITQPLALFLEDQVEESEALEAWDRWIDAMPHCLQELPDEKWRIALEKNRRDMILNALATNYPDTNAAILALLHWYGSSSGNWNGYPVYEDLAAAVLSWYPVRLLIRIIHNSALTPTQIEGAARLCCGKNFQTLADTSNAAWVLFPETQYLAPSGHMAFIPRRAGAPAQIPEELRQRLLNYCLQSSDEDKRARAISAYSS